MLPSHLSARHTRGDLLPATATLQIRIQFSLNSAYHNSFWSILHDRENIILIDNTCEAYNTHMCIVMHNTLF